MSFPISSRSWERAYAHSLHSLPKSISSKDVARVLPDKLSDELEREELFPLEFEEKTFPSFSNLSATSLFSINSCCCDRSIDKITSDIASINLLWATITEETSANLTSSDSRVRLVASRNSAKAPENRPLQSSLAKLLLRHHVFLDARQFHLDIHATGNTAYWYFSIHRDRGS